MTECEALDALAETARFDKTRMPELVAECRRLMRATDQSTRELAVLIAWYAVRQMFVVLVPVERLRLCDEVIADVDAAFAAGIEREARMIGNALRGLRTNMHARRGIIDDYDQPLHTKRS
jgi:hypothetical protein